MCTRVTCIIDRSRIAAGSSDRAQTVPSAKTRWHVLLNQVLSRAAADKPQASEEMHHAGMHTECDDGIGREWIVYGVVCNMQCWPYLPVEVRTVPWYLWILKASVLIVRRI